MLPVFAQGFVEGFVGATPLLNAQDHMQKTPQHHNGGKQAFPSRLGRFPAIKVDRLRLVVRLMRLGFFGKDAIGSG